MDLLGLTIHNLHRTRFLLGERRFFDHFRLFHLRNFRPFNNTINNWIQRVTRFFNAVGHDGHLIVLSHTHLLSIRHLLMIDGLTFRLIRFRFNDFHADLVLFLTFSNFYRRFILLFRASLRLVRVHFMTFSLLLLARYNLRRIRIVTNHLVVHFRVTFNAIILYRLAHRVSIFMLLDHRLLAQDV